MSSTAAYENEETANAVSHGIGALLSLPALYLLVVQALKNGHWTHVLGGTAFGASLFVLYACSTALHCARNPRVLERLEMLDHAAIYLLIAGTYTPLLLIAVRGKLGFVLLVFIWILALLGITLKLRYPGRFMAWSIVQYLGMGWLLLPVIPPLRQALPPQGIHWLLLGLLLYSTGSVFYFWRGFRYHHAVWHTFVLAGSLCHFIAVYAYVMYA